MTLFLGGNILVFEYLLFLCVVFDVSYQSTSAMSVRVFVSQCLFCEISIIIRFYSSRFALKYLSYKNY
ncbi:hypothetical protein BKH42_07070 [Helicobacter sp. 13S00482-2]|nr:hypothetical protein BKH42_07070 [Helicobacter sp. 13S00482-2]